MSEPFWTPLGGQPVDYEGAWNAATQYAPGDVVTYQGVTYLAVNPSLGSTPSPAAVAPAIGVALPVGAVDGQEFTLVDSLTAPTFAWRFVYFSGRASNKWVCIGGSAVSWVPAQESRGTAATYAALGTPGPQITVPVAGIYTIELSVVLVANGGWSQWMSYSIGATAAVDTDSITEGPQGDLARSRLDDKTLAAGTALVAQYRSDGSHTATFRNRLMRVTPIVVGG